MSQERLENLFKACDKRGTGFIDSPAFRELCASFEIEGEDADFIFADLDHDGDNRISFEDFAFGFRDFLTPGARRGSAQLGLTPPSPQVKRQTFRKNSGNKSELVNETLPSIEENKKSIYYKKDSSSVHINNVHQKSTNLQTLDAEKIQKEMETKQKAAANSWVQFTKHVGDDDINKFLEAR